MLSPIHSSTIVHAGMGAVGATLIESESSSSTFEILLSEGFLLCVGVPLSGNSGTLATLG